MYRVDGAEGRLLRQADLRGDSTGHGFESVGIHILGLKELRAARHERDGT